MSILPRVSVAVLVLLLWSFAAYAVDGQMGVVTGNPGKIMAGDKVLSEVPRGTQLWIFSEKPGWAEVKVPDQEQLGWLSISSIESITLTPAQTTERQQGLAHFKDYATQEKARQLAAARRSLEQCLEIFRRLYGKQHPDLAVVLNNLGVLAREQGDYLAARKFYDEALAIYSQVLGKEQISTADVLNNLGLLERDRGDYPAARKFYDEALVIKRTVLGNEHTSTAVTLNNLGILASDQGDYPAARKYYEEALQIERKKLGNDHPSTAETLNNLGNLVSNQGDYKAARLYFDEALKIKRKVLGNEHTSVALTLNNLGNLLSDQGDYPAARTFYEESLAIKRKLLGDDHLEIAGTLNNLGNLAKDQEDYPAARKFYDEALTIWRKNSGAGQMDFAITLNNQGVLAARQKDFPAARKSYDEALAIYRKILGNEHTSTARTLNNLGNMARAQGDFPAARKFLDESRRIVGNHVQRTLPGLSEAEQVRFLDNLYLQSWTRSLSFGWEQRADDASALTSAGWLINGKAVAHEALAARALLLRDAKNPQAAIIVQELLTARRTLATLTMSTPKPSEAAERQTKLAQLTADEQRLARSLAQVTSTTPAVGGWIEADAVRGALPTEAVYIDLIRMGIYDFEKQKRGTPRYLAWIMTPGKNTPLTILDLGDAAAIDESVLAAVAAINAAAKQDGPLRKDGEALATAAVTRELAKVAKLVLQPLMPHLASKKQLILSPDGALWLLPWAALPVATTADAPVGNAGKSDSPNNANTQLLLERCALRLVTSGRELVRPAGQSKLQRGAPVIVVNPDFDLTGQMLRTVIQKLLPAFKFDDNATRGLVSASSMPQAQPLPNTAIEGMAAKPLLAKLAGREPISYQDDEALETVIKTLPRPSHVLFATHGFFLPDQELKPRVEQLLAANDTRSWPVMTTNGKPVENPLLRCGLLFAGCNAPRTPGLDDGILTGMEIVGMDLRGTELVVLSACETGIGKVRNGEGVAGLRQAFQLAGAQSVVSTLWQVPDRDSALIMQDFFTNLAAGQSKADALRNAQLKRIAARKEKTGAAHPFFWAAWTVTGQ